MEPQPASDAEGRLGAAVAGVLRDELASYQAFAATADRIKAAAGILGAEAEALSAVSARVCEATGAVRAAVAEDSLRSMEAALTRAEQASRDAAQHVAALQAIQRDLAG